MAKIEWKVNKETKSEYITHIWYKDEEELKNDYQNCALELFKALYDDALNFNGSSGRTKRINFCVYFYNTFENLSDYYEYHPNAHYIKDRFTFHSNTNKREWIYDIPKNNILDDGIDYSAPLDKGLYFIGQVNMNPFTKEEYYWVKVGMTSQTLQKRMNQYNSSNPMMWRIDYKPNAEMEESYYHYLLNSICVARNGHNDEWFLVTRKAYLEMCEKGFAYFD